MNRLGNLNTLANECPLCDASTPEERAAVREEFKKIGTTRIPFWSLITSIAITIFALAFSSTAFVVIGCVLTGISLIVCRDDIRFFGRVRELLNIPFSEDYMYLDALLFSAKRSRDVAKKIFDALLENTLILKRIYRPQFS